MCHYILEFGCLWQCFIIMKHILMSDTISILGVKVVYVWLPLSQQLYISWHSVKVYEQKTHLMSERIRNKENLAVLRCKRLKVLKTNPEENSDVW